jgi:hypothetical protein
MKYFHLYITVFLLLFSSVFVRAENYTVYGIVIDKETRIPVELASVYINELAQGANTYDKGLFEIRNVSAGSYHFRVSYLGYETIDSLIQINRVMHLNFYLTKTSLLLKEVNVMAREKPQSATTSSIKRAAIEHLQPSSMGDLLQLLPGGLLSDSKLNTSNQVSMRQAGTDNNTAMGTAVVVDGVPMSNNANMQSFYGTNNTTDVSNTKNPVNGGVDLRQISTDHVDEVEVIRGIPSVKYGDLTSGAIIVKSKKGETPLTFRIKSDPLNKLVYVGKGYRLPKDAGTINFGIDYTKYVADQRSPFDQYQRITSSLSYEKLIRKVFLSTTQVGFTGTIDKQVTDPDIMNKEDNYQSDYKSFKLSNSGTWNINKGILYKAEYTLSANYAQDILNRTNTVTLNSPIGISLSNAEGESLGMFLPSEYLSTYKVDGKPFNFYSQLTTYLHPKIGKTFNNLLLGVEFRLDKNFGDGSIYDLTRPPFPNMSSSSRPRAPKDIPSMQKLTVFAEDNFTAKVGEGKLGITAGLRGTRLGNLSSLSAMYNKFYIEPRLNINYQLPAFQLFDNPFEMGIKGGFGDQLKFPTTFQLYPEKAYYDISELNYYSTSNENNRMVYLLTKIKDRTNNDLTAARNRKYEIGFDLNYKGVSLNVTAFSENENNGFEEQSMYFPQSYNLYDASSFTGTGKPTVNDFTYQSKKMFLSYSFTTNAAKIIKKGIEYQLSTKKISAINTEIVLNGAWFQTQYDISQPRYKYPNIVSNGDYYPYVGVFNAGSDSKINEQLNTTLFLNTHFSKQRLLFSTSIQTVWYTSYQMIKYNGIPDSYIDLNNNVLLFTESEKQNPAFKPLIETFSTAYFDPERTPVSLEVNLKVTKEIGNNLKLSFFVNRLLDYNPRYTTRFGVSTQKWVIPFMGAEIQVKL